MTCLAPDQRCHAPNRLKETERNRLLLKQLGHVSKENWYEAPTLTEMMDRPVPTNADAVQDLRARGAEIVAATLGTASHALTDGEDQILDDLDQRRVLAKLRAAIETLDPESKAFVQLYFDDGLTVDEVAKRLKVVRRTVFRIQERVNAKLIAAIDKM